MRLVRIVLGCVLLQLLMTGCATQHYVVGAVRQVQFAPPYSLRALGGRHNGYALSIENTSKDVLAIAWDQARIVQNDGHEVSVTVNPRTKIATIHPRSKVTYHLRPAHVYEAPERVGKTQEQIWWQDRRQPWPPQETRILIPYRPGTECLPDCRDWTVGVLVATLRPERGGMPQEVAQWADDTIYRPPVAETRVRLSTTALLSKFSAHEAMSSTTISVAAGYWFSPTWGVDVVYVGHDYGSTTSGATGGQLSAESTFLGVRGSWSRSLFGPVRLIPFVQIGSNWVSYRWEESGGLNRSGFWEQNELMVGGGGQLSLGLGPLADVFLTAEHNAGVIPSTNDDGVVTASSYSPGTKGALTQFGLGARIHF